MNPWTWIWIWIPGGVVVLVVIGISALTWFALEIFAEGIRRDTAEIRRRTEGLRAKRSVANGTTAEDISADEFGDWRGELTDFRCSRRKGHEPPCSIQADGWLDAPDPERCPQLDPR